MYARQYAFVSREGSGKEAILESAAGAGKGPLGLAAALAKELFDGTIFRIPKDTQVQLLEQPGVRAHILVLDGGHAGQRGVTMTKMLSPQP